KGGGREMVRKMAPVDARCERWTRDHLSGWAWKAQTRRSCKERWRREAQNAPCGTSRLGHARTECVVATLDPDGSRRRAPHLVAHSGNDAARDAPGAKVRR